MCLTDSVRNASVRSSAFCARAMLSQHSSVTNGPAILGKPSDISVSDHKFSDSMKLHVRNGELLAQGLPCPRHRHHINADLGPSETDRGLASHNANWCDDGQVHAALSAHTRNDFGQCV